MRASDHRLAEGHRFQKHQAKTFATAGQSKNVAACVAGEELFEREAVEKMGAF